MQVDNVILLILKIVSIGTLIGSLEGMSLFKDLNPGGRLCGIYLLNKKNSFNFFLFHRNMSKTLTVTSFFISIYFLLAISLSTLTTYMVFIHFLLLLHQTHRSPFGGDGSAQLNLLIFGAISAGLIIDTTNSKYLAIFFIATQSIMSYAIAGISKLFGALWRDGSALHYIMRTRTYGSQFLYNLTKSNRAISATICKLITIWECLFPLAILKPFTMFFLVTGFLFHLGNAFIMGLNIFLWSFSATYPAIYFIVSDDLVFEDFSTVDYLLVFAISVHLVWTLIAQTNTKIGNIAKAKDAVGIIPYWTFFAPNPLTYDYRVLYVSRDSETTNIEDWDELDLNIGRRWHHFIYNPNKRYAKSCIDMIQAIIKYMDELNESNIILTAPYLILSQAIEFEITQKRLDVGHEGFQYLIIRDVGYESDSYEVVLHSAFHPYS